MNKAQPNARVFDWTDVGDFLVFFMAVFSVMFFIWVGYSITVPSKDAGQCVACLNECRSFIQEQDKALQEVKEAAKRFGRAETHSSGALGNQSPRQPVFLPLSLRLASPLMSRARSVLTDYDPQA